MEDLLKARKLIKSQIKNDILSEAEKQQLQSMSNDLKFIINHSFGRVSKSEN